MKAILFFASYAALVSAAPQGFTDSLMKRESPIRPEPINPIEDRFRCGNSSPEGYKCPKTQVCAAADEIGDGKGGVCVPNPKPCANANGDTCPSGEHICVKDPRIVCKKGEMDCGGGLCVPPEIAKAVGLKKPETRYRPAACGGSTGVKKCPQSNVCVGETDLANGNGLCIADPIKCGGFRGPQCPDDTKYYCLNDPRVNCPKGVMDCGSGICVRQDWAIKYGGGLKKVTPKTISTTKTTPTIKTTSATKSTTTTPKKTTTTAKATTTTTKATTPTPNTTPKRCGGPTGKKCATGESCLGEREFDDGIGGVCVKNPGRCANFLGDTCAKGDYCVEDPDENCPPNVQDCGNKLCLPDSVVKQIGVKTVGSWPFRCGGNSGKKCRDNLYEVCVGEKESNDGVGICIGHPMACGGATGKKCFDENYFYCINDPRIKCTSKQKNCGGGICIPGDTADLYGMKNTGGY
ncbi:hypothetical protein ABW20_dc0102903 [Dactylellina cionopaga]|nr:hypothetical protein ABW20_dc0102903 [Dactylellina cionopaga]